MGGKMTKPAILMPNSYSEGDVAALCRTSLEVVDIVDRQLVELFRIQNPSKKDDSDDCKQYIEKFDQNNTAWVLYPWSKQVLHCLGPDDLFTLRTNRNKQIVTEEEQQKLTSVTVGIAGMSVGAGMAVSLAYSGISQTMKLADFDVLDTTNLNRLRESLLSVGQPKVELAAHHIYELDPFADVLLYPDGLNDDLCDNFFLKPKIDLIIDEIDDFRMKVRLRQQAKLHKIPLLMFTSLGDNILVDVERYDLNPNLELFNGLIGNVSEEILSKSEITPEDARRYAVTLVGAQYVPTRAIGSLLEMGKSLVGRPQLYSTIATDGGLAAYVVRQIVLQSKPTSGRYFIKFAELFGMESQDLSDSQERQDFLRGALS